MSIPISQGVNARVGLNAINYTYNDSTSNVDYKSNLKLNTVDVLADWFPFDNGFRLTTGLVFNANKIIASGRPNSSGNFTVNGITYSSANVGQLDGKSLLVAVSLNWQRVFRRRLTMLMQW